MTTTMVMQILAVLAVTAFSGVLTDQALVLVDNLSLRETHSMFFKRLTDRGHVLTVKSADDASLALFKYDEPLFDHLILFCPTVEEFGGSISVSEIVKFIDQGGNVLIGANSNVGEALRELANEVNFEFDDEKTSVIDHMHYDAQLDDGHHTTLVVDPASLIKAPYIVGQRLADPILFRGVGLVTDKQNVLTLEVLTAASSAYSHNPDSPIEQYPHAIGKQTVLIGALQARNNARVVITGSIDMFSDEFLLAQVTPSSGGQMRDRSGNEQLVAALTDWLFKQKGVIRVKSVNHNLVGQKSPPHAYTITDMAEFSIEIEELRDGRWVPFEASDVQMEFVRIDPFVRATLKANKNGLYSVRFKVPDVYGVYKFVVDYNRLGLTYLYSVTQVSVRPFEHTQFERFIRSAFPYYASAFSMMIGVVLFSCVFLHFKDAPGKNE